MRSISSRTLTRGALVCGSRAMSLFSIVICRSSPCTFRSEVRVALRGLRGGDEDELEIERFAELDRERAKE